MDNKKTIIASIIGVALLVVLVVGATFAYFTTAVTNDNGETLVTGKTDAIGSIALTNPTRNLYITLSALDMAQENLGAYYATDDASKNYDTEEVQREIAVATLTGGSPDTHYECTTTIHVTTTIALMDGLQPGDAYFQFSGAINEKVDLSSFKWAFPVTFKLNGTDALTQSVSASFSIVNRDANQNGLAGKNFTFKFYNDDLECNVIAGSGVEDEIIPEGAEAFAIYSETDKSLRFYKNLDFDDVNVGDTYKDLVVTAKYTGFETAEYINRGSAPWAKHNSTTEIVVIENKISPVSTANWFAAHMDWGGWSATMDLSKLDTSSTTNTGQMFMFSPTAVLIGLDKWDTSNVTNMHGLFRTASNIPDISGWDTSNVTNMYGMFYGAQNIPDISGWDVSNVTDMQYMFVDVTTGYTAENPLDLSGWDVSNVTNSLGFIDAITPTGSIIEPNFK